MCALDKYIFYSLEQPAGQTSDCLQKAMGVYSLGQRKGEILVLVNGVCAACLTTVSVSAASH